MTVLVAAVWFGGYLASESHPAPGSDARVVTRWGLRGVLLALLALTLTWALRHLSAFARQVDDLVRYADEGNLALIAAVTLISGVAEELFFRGALYSAVKTHPIVAAAAAHAAVTAVTGNLPLTAAAFVLGLVAGAARRATGSPWPAAATHVAFSLTMLALLPGLT